MTNIYSELYELAKTDFQAANILSQNHLYTQAIYFYSQTFEKCIKAVIAFYMMIYNHKTETVTEVMLRKTHGHRLIELTKDLQRKFIAKEVELYTSTVGKITDDFIQNLYRSIDNRKPRYTIDYLIAFFNKIVKERYEIFYKSLDGGQSLTFYDPRWKYLRNLFADPATKYSKFAILSLILAPLLEKMDVYARYPSGEVQNRNIKLLMEEKNRESCQMLAKMIADLISLVPVVWEKIK